MSSCDALIVVRQNSRTSTNIVISKIENVCFESNSSLSTFGLDLNVTKTLASLAFIESSLIISKCSGENIVLIILNYIHSVSNGLQNFNICDSLRCKKNTNTQNNYWITNEQTAKKYQYQRNRHKISENIERTVIPPKCIWIPSYVSCNQNTTLVFRF